MPLCTHEDILFWHHDSVLFNIAACEVLFTASKNKMHREGKCNFVLETMKTCSWMLHGEEMHRQEQQQSLRWGVDGSTCIDSTSVYPHHGASVGFADFISCDMTPPLIITLHAGNNKKSFSQCINKFYVTVQTDCKQTVITESNQRPTNWGDMNNIWQTLAQWID